MALTGITIDNYRVFEEPTHLELRPLTILTGPNNSGKSSIVKWLQFLSKNFADNKLTSLSTEGTDFHSVRSILPKQKDFSFELFFESDTKDYVAHYFFGENSIYKAIGKYRNVNIEDIMVEGEMVINFKYHTDLYNDLYHLDCMELELNEIPFFSCEYLESDNKFKIDFYLRNFLHSVSFCQTYELRKSPYDIMPDLTYRYHNKPTHEEVYHDLMDSFCEHLNDYSLNKNKIEHPFYYFLPKYLKLIESFPEIFIIPFHTDVPSFYDGTFWKDNENPLESIGLILKQTKEEFKGYFDKNTGWTSADFDEFLKNMALYLRNIISSFILEYIKKLLINLDYESFELNKAHYKRDGENILFLQNIIHDKKPDFFMSDDNVLQSFLKASLDRFDLQKVYLNKNDEELTVKVTTRSSGVTFDLADVGLGYSKIIQLIYGLGRNLSYDDYPLTELLTFEEPENSLHPDYQSLLADVFVDYTNLCADKTVIIETHSEYFIRKLQYLVKTGKLRPNHVIIHYFGKQPHPEETVRSIEILPNGRLSQEFGPGFFDEAARLISLLYEPQMEN